MLGLAGVHQQQNATLATHLVKSFLESQASFKGDALPESFVKGLEGAQWPGRCQTVVDPNRKNITWYLDGAHTVESLACCVQWFISPGVGLESHGELKYIVLSLPFVV